jgi:hypothetical protein
MWYVICRKGSNWSYYVPRLRTSAIWFTTKMTREILCTMLRYSQTALALDAQCTDTTEMEMLLY